MTETQLLAFIMTEHAKHRTEISSRQLEGIRECVVTIVDILDPNSDALVSQRFTTTVGSVQQLNPGETPYWGAPYPSGESFGVACTHSENESSETQSDGPGFSFIGMFRKGKAPITRSAKSE